MAVPFFFGGYMFKGVFTALVTPMTTQGAIDYNTLGRLLDAQLAAGVHGLVLLGTTAETPTLSSKEKEELLHFCTQRVQKRIKIIIGAGTNATASTVENIRMGQAFNPDGILVVTPYYNKPNTSGLIEHFKQAAKAGIPLILYHIPGRTGLKISAGVLAELLAEVPQIVGIKESDYDIAHVTDTSVKFSNRVSYLCGNDDLFPEFLAINSSGIISAAANIFAPAFVKIYNLFQQGKTAEAFSVFTQVYPLIKACYLETNPTCVKYMLSKIGFGTDIVRLPLGEISEENKLKIDRLLQATDPSLFIK